MLFDTGSQKVILDVGAYTPGPTSTELFTGGYSFGATGNFTVEVYSDTVALGGIALQGVSVGVATEGSPGAVVPTDVARGVLGLGFHGTFYDEPPGTQTTGLLEELYAQKGIRGFLLDVVGDSGGTMVVGDVGEAVPGMAYLPVSQLAGEYEWYVTSARINGIPYLCLVDSGGGDDGLVDTRTFLALARKLRLPVVDDLYDDDTLSIVAECGTKADITLEFGATRIKLAQELLWDEIRDGPYQDKCSLRIYGIKQRTYANLGEWRR